MQRLFPEHHVRRQIELSPLWTLTTLDAGGLDHPVQTVVPAVNANAISIIRVIILFLLFFPFINLLLFLLLKALNAPFFNPEF